MLYGMQRMEFGVAQKMVHHLDLVELTFIKRKIKRRGVRQVTKLRRARMMSCLLQIEVANMLGISASYMSLLESGAKPLTEKLKLNLSKIYKIKIDG